MDQLQLNHDKTTDRRVGDCLKSEIRARIFYGTPPSQKASMYLATADLKSDFTLMFNLSSGTLYQLPQERRNFRVKLLSKTSSQFYCILCIYMGINLACVPRNADLEKTLTL